MHPRNLTIAAGVAAGLAATLLVRRRFPIDFRNRTAFITGGSRGLGLLLAREFVARGARVAIAARDADELARAEKQLRADGGDVLAIEADMTMREEAENAVRKVENQFGAVDILVNNAGTISVGPIETMTIDDYRNSINAFLGTVFHDDGSAARNAAAAIGTHRQHLIDRRKDQRAAPGSILRGEVCIDGFLRRPSVRTAEGQGLCDHGMPGADADRKSTQRAVQGEQRS